MPVRAWVLSACVLALAACATGPATRPGLPAVEGDPAQHQAWREAVLADQPAWSMQGRVALSNGRDGGSGRIDWRQDGARYDVALSAPVTRQSWRLSGEPGRAVLAGLEGGDRQGTDAATLLREATRWDIPVEALASWVRGAAADPGRFGAPVLAYGDDGRLSSLAQGGWRIDYADWRAGGASLALPYRLNAVRGDSRVRLVVDAWGQGGAE